MLFVWPTWKLGVGTVCCMATSSWPVDAGSNQRILFVAPTKAVASCCQGLAVLISATITIKPPDTALRARDGVHMCGITWWCMRCQAEPPWHA